MSDNSFDVPAALFLNLICHNINMPDEHAIVVLALIDRFCSKVAELNYDQIDFTKEYQTKEANKMPLSNNHK